MDEEQPRTNDLYDMEAVLDAVRDAARLYLSDPWTVETIRWEDGDFRVEAFHTIDATYPFEEEAETPGGLDGDDARPFYRERVVFSTVRDAGYVFLEVVRKRTGRTASESVYRTPVEWVGPRDPRTSDASEWLFENGSTIRFHGDADVEGVEGGPNVLRDLELTQISLVPTEEALDGNRVVDTVPYGEREFEFSGSLRFEEDEDSLTVSVDNYPRRIPRTVETVGDLRDALELDAGRELVRVVEGDEDIYPGQSRLGVDRLGDPDEPVVVSEGDAFLTKEVEEGA